MRIGKFSVPSSAVRDPVNLPALIQMMGECVVVSVACDFRGILVYTAMSPQFEENNSPETSGFYDPEFSDPYFDGRTIGKNFNGFRRIR